MKNIAFIAFLLTAILALNSCTVKETKYPLSPGLVNYFNWQQGTYWTFKDSLTGKIDSVAVATYYRHWQGADKDERNDESVSINLEQYKTNGDSVDWNLTLRAVNVTDLSPTHYNHGYSFFTEGIPFTLNSRVSDVKKAFLDNIVINEGL